MSRGDLREEPVPGPAGGPPAATPVAGPLFLLTGANYLLALLLSYQYIADSTVFSSLPGAIFTHLAFFAQLGTFILAVALLPALLGLPRVTRPLIRPTAALLFSLLQGLIFVDGRIYALFRFHINSLVLNVVTTPGGLKSAEIPGGQVAAAAAAFALLLLGQYWLYGRLAARFAGARPPLRRPGAAWKRLVAAVLLAAVAERALFVWGDFHRMAEITRMTRLVPFYQPLRLRKLERRLGIETDVTAIPLVQSGKSMLQYPRQPVIGRVGPDAPNVLWIVLDGWRSDLLDAETTPRMWDFARTSQVFRRHVSGGNCTRLGIFSMFYGLHGTYWRPFLTEGRGPVLVDKFREAGYRFRILSSTSLEYPEFKRTVFSAVLPDVNDRVAGAMPWEKDASLVREFTTFADGLPPGQRFFSFLFMDGSHNPFESPPAFRKFQPAAESINFLDIRQRAGMPALFNRYRNAVSHEDHLVGEVLAYLEQRKLLERTLVVITADHGNEFYEHGYFGYNGAFTPEEVDVPLILHVPGMAPREVSYLTTHQDIPATVLRLAGVTDDPSAYGVGRDLFDPAVRPYALPCSFTTCALLDDEGCLIFGAASETMLRFEGRDRDYRELADPSAAVRSRTGKISQLLKEMRTFLK